MRLQRAISEADLGLGSVAFRANPLVATNRALRMLGAPQIRDINSRREVLRAVIYIESAEGT
tara:strand:+ start:43 stop:228 length:186 start_codon:yes stop_codon:yes gene_type:complete